MAEGGYAFEFRLYRGPDRRQYHVIIAAEHKTGDLTHSNRDLQLKMAGDLKDRQHRIFINVINHYEVSAPMAVRKIEALLSVPIL